MRIFRRRIHAYCTVHYSPENAYIAYGEELYLITGLHGDAIKYVFRQSVLICVICGEKLI